MKMIKISFLRMFFVWVAMLFVQPVYARNVENCIDWKDAEYCTAYSIIEFYRETGDAEYLPIMIKIVDHGGDDIGYYATFWLLHTLLNKHENFFQSEDYYSWKRKLIVQLTKYQEIVGDNEKAQAYLIYLFRIIEPISTLQTSDYGQRVKRVEIPEKYIKYLSCMVMNDVPFLGHEQVTELNAFKECLK